MNSVLPMLTALPIARTCAGSVESSTCNFGKPGCCPKVCVITSGPRLDPPMPSTTASVNPCPFTQAAKSRQSVSLLCSVEALSSQPSHLSSSVPVQIDLSCCHKRRILPDARHSSVLVSTALEMLAPSVSFC